MNSPLWGSVGLSAGIWTCTHLFSHPSISAQKGFYYVSGAGGLEISENMVLTFVEFQAWRRKWQSTPVFLPGEFHGQRSLASCSPWGCKESDMTEGLTQRLSSVQSFICVRLFATPRTAACQASLSITSSQSLLKLVSIESVMPSNHLNFCRPLFLPPSIFSQHQGLFKWVSSSHQVARVLEFQLQHQSFQWIFRTDLL